MNVNALLSRGVGLLKSFLRSNAAIYLGGAVLSRIGAIVLIPLYTRRLTPDDYGEYALVASVLTVLPHCISLGLSAGIARVFFAEKDPGLAAKKMGSVARGMILTVLLLGTLLAALLHTFAPPMLFGIHKRFLLLATLAGGATGIGMIPELFFRSAQRPKAAVSLQLVSFVTMTGGGLLFVIGLNRGVDGVVEAATTAALVMGAIGTTFILTKLPAGHVVDETKKAIVFSLPLVPNVLAYWVQLTADRWILTAFGQTAALGTYYLAVQLLSPIQMVTASWNDAQAAKYGELYRAEGPVAAFKALRSYYRSYALVTLVPIVGLLVGSPLLPILIGSRFLGAISIMPILCAGYLADAFYYPATNYLFYIGRTTFIPAVTVTMAVISTGLAILLLPRFGLAGLVVSRFLGSAIRAVAFIVAARIARRRVEQL